MPVNSFGISMPEMTPFGHLAELAALQNPHGPKVSNAASKEDERGSRRLPAIAGASGLAFPAKVVITAGRRDLAHAIAKVIDDVEIPAASNLTRPMGLFSSPATAEPPSPPSRRRRRREFAHVRLPATVW